MTLVMYHPEQNALLLLYPHGQLEDVDGFYMWADEAMLTAEGYEVIGVL